MTAYRKTKDFVQSKPLGLLKRAESFKSAACPDPVQDQQVAVLRLSIATKSVGGHLWREFLLRAGYPRAQAGELPGKPMDRKNTQPFTLSRHFRLAPWCSVNTVSDLPYTRQPRRFTGPYGFSLGLCQWQAAHTQPTLQSAPPRALATQLRRGVKLLRKHHYRYRCQAPRPTTPKSLSDNLLTIIIAQSISAPKLLATPISGITSPRPNNRCQHLWRCRGCLQLILAPGHPGGRFGNVITAIS